MGSWVSINKLNSLKSNLKFTVCNFRLIFFDSAILLVISLLNLSVSIPKVDKIEISKIKKKLKIKID